MYIIALPDTFNPVTPLGLTFSPLFTCFRFSLYSSSCRSWVLNLVAVVCMARPEGREPGPNRPGRAKMRALPEKPKPGRHACLPSLIAPLYRSLEIRRACFQGMISAFGNLRQRDYCICVCARANDQVERD